MTDATDWVEISQNEIEKFIRERVGNVPLDSVQVIHEDGTVLNGWCSIVVRKARVEQIDD